MFRTLVRRSAGRATRQQRANNPMLRSAISRSSAASTTTILVNDSFGNHSFLKHPAASSLSRQFHTSVPKLDDAAAGGAAAANTAPFEKLMAANRGEIATRIVRAASELGIKTAGIYAHEGKPAVSNIISYI